MANDRSTADRFVDLLSAAREARQIADQLKVYTASAGVDEIMQSVDHYIAHATNHLHRLRLLATQQGAREDV